MKKTSLKHIRLLTNAILKHLLRNSIRYSCINNKFCAIWYRLPSRLIVWIPTWQWLDFGYWPDNGLILDTDLTMAWFWILTWHWFGFGYWPDNGLALDTDLTMFWLLTWPWLGFVYWPDRCVAMTWRWLGYGYGLCIRCNCDWNYSMKIKVNLSYCCLQNWGEEIARRRRSRR